MPGPRHGGGAARPLPEAALAPMLPPARGNGATSLFWPGPGCGNGLPDKLGLMRIKAAGARPRHNTGHGVVLPA